MAGRKGPHVYTMISLEMLGYKRSTAPLRPNRVKHR